jgi:ABC-type methionine transport system ATPase subunit
MTPQDEICLRLKDLLSKEAKQKLKFCLNTVNLCNKHLMIIPEQCIPKLQDHLELLMTRIEYLESQPYDEVVVTIKKYQQEFDNTKLAIEEIKQYELRRNVLG